MTRWGGGARLGARVVLAPMMAAALFWPSERGDEPSGARTPAVAPRQGSPSLRGSTAAIGVPAARTPPAPERSGLDLKALVDQVHFAFRPVGTAFASSHATYDVSVEAGELSFTPRHFPAGAEERARVAPSLAGGSAERGPVTGATLRFGAARIRRGTELVGAGATAASTNSRAQLELVRPGVVERLASGPDGVQQSWTFASAPEGSGDLEVRIALPDGAAVHETGSGVHLDAAPLYVRYGHAVWIDQLGNRTAVSTLVDSGDLVLRVPGEVLAGSVFPAVLDPVISPELGIDGPVRVPSPGYQLGPALSWNGTTFLVVWMDRVGTYSDVRGARVTPVGVVLDPGGFSVSSAPFDQSYPAVGWNGTTHLVVWHDFRSGRGSPDVYGARVAESGTVLDPDGIAIRAGSGFNEAPNVASNGDDFLVVWHESTAARVYGARLSASGAVRDADGFPISTGSAHVPVASWNGATYLVAWMRGSYGAYDVHAARVTPAGVVLDPTGIPICTAPGDQEAPSVSWDGTNHLVLWSDRRSRTDADVYGSRVTPAGEVLDGSGVVVSGAAGDQVGPRASWDGASHLVVWQDRRSGTYDVYGARVSTSGAVADPAGFEIATGPGDHAFAAVAFDGARHLVVWQDPGNGGEDIVGTLVGTAGGASSGPRVLVSRGSVAPTPAISWDGANALVVWEHCGVGPTYGLCGARITEGGALLDPAGIVIDPGTSSPRTPAVSWNGSSHLVVWRSGTSLGVQGARLSAAGEVLDAEPIPIASVASVRSRPALSWDGATHLVVWEDIRNGPADIYGARVSAAGVVRDPAGISISTAIGVQAEPAVAWNGTTHLVVWHDQRSDTAGDIYGARVTPDGEVVETSGVVISDAAGAQQHPTVASNGTDFLVVWDDSRAGSPEIFGVTVDPGGVISTAAGARVCSGPGGHRSPALAWDGASHLVAWQDDQPGGSSIHAARMSGAGIPVEGSAFQVSGGQEAAEGVVLAASRPWHFLAAYRGFDVATGSHVLVRSILPNAPPSARDALVTIGEDRSVPITLAATDPDGDPLTFTTVTSPAHGTLTGTPPDLTYVPAANYHGDDAFSFTASDGTFVSSVATVTITVTAVNDAPVTYFTMPLGVNEDEALPLTLLATDVDGDPLTFTIVSGPTHGTLTGTPPDVTYVPEANFNGTDAFTFRASDGQLDSTVTQDVLVWSINDAPVALDGTVSVARGESVPVYLFGTDVDRDPLTFTTVTVPTHGTLSGTSPVLTYTPSPGYVGPDAFTYRASDSTALSAPATVAITVTFAPVGSGSGCGCASGGPGAVPLLGALATLILRRRRPGPPADRPPRPAWGGGGAGGC